MEVSPQNSRRVWNILRNRDGRCKILSINNEQYTITTDEKETVFECLQLTDETLSKIITSYTGEKADTKRWVNYSLALRVLHTY